MNDLAKKTYELLMTQPEWFNMARHETCILGALYRVVHGEAPSWAPSLDPRVASYFKSTQGAELLGTPNRDVFMFWFPAEDTDAIAAAQRLKAACEQSGKNTGDDETARTTTGARELVYG
jgi:hypothetical protein